MRDGVRARGGWGGNVCARSVRSGGARARRRDDGREIADAMARWCGVNPGEGRDARGRGAARMREDVGLDWKRDRCADAFARGGGLGIGDDETMNARLTKRATVRRARARRGRLGRRQRERRRRMGRRRWWR